MSSGSKVVPSTSAATSSASSSNLQPSVTVGANPTSIDTSRAAAGVWLVKVPNYLARKWTEAPENTEVGVIRITQSKLAIF